MKKLKKVIVASLAFIMAFALVGCGGDKGGSAKTLYSNGGPQEFFETPWLNPGTFMYNKVLYSRLIVADEKLNPIEGDKDALAKSYTYSADGKKLTFELRDDIYWHDGEKITGEDVKWSIEYASKTAVLNAVFKSTFSAIAGSEGGKAATFSGIKVDGNKIEINFEKVAPDALLTFTQFAPLPKKHLENVDPLKLQQDKYFQSPVGSGPFKVDKVQMKDYASLAPFDKYYNGVAKFNITLTSSPGDSDPNFVNNAKSGKLDFGYTKSVADIKALKGDDKISTTPVNVRYTRLFYVNKFPNKKNGKV
ncbi:MAG: ABC transporter substrate-binding protein, partial [Coprobacillus sp.]